MIKKNYRQYNMSKVGICSSDVISAHKKDIRKLERIQRADTRMTPELKDLT